ncbi:MAG: NAD(P)H-dependent oxidoreductase [Saprospiraceae bacterium]|nr:NAD(P)H-dependent oxidoreductase [Saprospiraceae bacterium]
MKKILILNGHPDKESFNAALTEAYAKGARAQANTQVDVLYLADLTFDPILRYGYRKRTELEPDLLHAFELLKEADHTVWIYPTWWGGMPALLKGFIDRLFLPGFTFEYRENSPFWDKLMKGKTARVITTMDAPVWYYRLTYNSAGHKVIKRVILGFCGFKVKFFTIGNLKNSSDQLRKKWLEKVETLGTKEAGAIKVESNQNTSKAELSMG